MFPEPAFIVEAGFTSDGRRLVVRCLGDNKERLTVLDSGDGHVMRMISVPEPAYPSAALHLSGHRLAIAKRKHAYVCDLDHPDEAFQVCQGHEFDLLNLAVRPDGSRLVSVDVAGVVKEWNLAGPTPGLKTPFSSGVGSSVLLTPDETRVIFVPTNDEFDSTNENRPSAGFLRVTDGKGKRPVEIGPQLPGGHLHLLTLSADSRNLACLWDSGRDYTFLVVDMVEGRERLRKVFRPGSWVTGGAFAPDASRAVLLTDRVDTSTNPALNRELRVYDAATGRELRAWKDPQAGTSFRGGCYSPDGRWLVIERIRGADHRIVWLDAETLAEGASIRVEKPLAKAVFSRDGRQVAILQTMSRLGGLIDVWAVEPLLRATPRGRRSGSRD